jgi:hypothetical protein
MVADAGVPYATITLGTAPRTPGRCVGTIRLEKGDAIRALVRDCVKSSVRSVLQVDFGKDTYVDASSSFRLDNIFVERLSIPLMRCRNLDDVVEAARGLDVAVPWWREMDEARQGVLLNMAFNMGVPRLMGFKKALGAMSIGDYARAGTEMLDSKWAVQVKWRSAELARQMVLGEWE